MWKLSSVTSSHDLPQQWAGDRRCKCTVRWNITKKMDGIKAVVLIECGRQERPSTKDQVGPFLVHFRRKMLVFEDIFGIF